ncbi:MAG TPA: hypothetical protein VGE45_13430 [Chloroflexia bacterium]|jgi:hypothetical protein
MPMSIGEEAVSVQIRGKGMSIVGATRWVALVGLAYHAYLLARTGRPTGSPLP